MVVYSVKITAQIPVFESLLKWLESEHIQEVLSCEGFVRAELRHGKSGVALESSSQDILIDYYIENEDLFRKYLKEKAMELRQKALDQFPGQFSAVREVWKHSINFNNTH